jgi:hypothetical protein
MRMLALALLFVVGCSSDTFTVEPEGTWVAMTHGMAVNLVLENGAGTSCVLTNSMRINTSVTYTNSARAIGVVWQSGGTFSGSFESEDVFSGVKRFVGEDIQLTFHRGNPTLPGCM